MVKHLWGGVYRDLKYDVTLLNEDEEVYFGTVKV